MAVRRLHGRSRKTAYDSHAVVRVFQDDKRPDGNRCLWKPHPMKGSGPNVHDHGVLTRSCVANGRLDLDESSIRLTGETPE